MSSIEEVKTTTYRETKYPINKNGEIIGDPVNVGLKTYPKGASRHKALNLENGQWFMYKYEEVTVTVSKG